jgi:glycosyltransferase involved in cell wall biosynthesis
MSDKPICVIQGPFATRSGYGDMARDIIRHIASLDRYDLKLVSMPWGACPTNALSEANPKDAEIIKHIVPIPVQLPRQPELYIQISVPNEFQPVGKYNIGITAGIETTLCSVEWLQGMNRMDLILTISEHSKRILEGTTVEQRTPDGRVVGSLKLEKPIEVLHCCVDTSIFRRVEKKDIPFTILSTLKNVKEEFNFLFVGHWMKGNMGEDRKNVGMLVKIFCETFKGAPANVKPGLILKTSGAGFSIMDRESILSKIRSVRQSVGENCPNVYLLHGELTEDEMNGLYNHPKVKAHVSFTKGEGFGRPLLEATMSRKPVIASGWSGHLDFLNPDDALLIGGELKNVEPGAVWPGVILPEAQWFNIDPNEAAKALYHVFKNHGKHLDGAYRIARKNEELFSYQAIEKRTHEIIDARVPKFAVAVPMNLPKLKKVTG